MKCENEEEYNDYILGADARLFSNSSIPYASRPESAQDRMGQIYMDNGIGYRTSSKGNRTKAQSARRKKAKAARKARRKNRKY